MHPVVIMVVLAITSASVFAAPCDSNPCPSDMPCLNVDASRYSCKRHCNATLTGQQLWAAGGIDAGYQFVAQLDPVTRTATGTSINITLAGLSTDIAAVVSTQMWSACRPVNGIVILSDVSRIANTKIARVNLTSATLLNYFTLSGQALTRVVGCDATNSRVIISTASNNIKVYNTSTGAVLATTTTGGTSTGTTITTPFRPNTAMLVIGSILAEYNLTKYVVTRTALSTTLFGVNFLGTINAGLNSVAYDADGRYLYIPFQQNSATYDGVLKVDPDNGYKIVSRFNATLNAIPFWGVIDPSNIYGYWAAGATTMTWLMKIDLRTMTLVGNSTSPYFNGSSTIELDPIQSVVIPSFGGSVYDTNSLQDVGALDALGMNVQRTAFFAYPGGTYGPCRYNGTCWGDTCSCAPGFSGAQCEWTPCNSITPSVCQNNGTCTPSPFVNATGYTCTCDAAGQFYGPQCQYNALDLCTTQPCLNGGTCTGGNTTSFVCQCPANYGGTICSHVLPCVSNPCPSDMPCVNVDATHYSCKRHCNATLTGQQMWAGGSIDGQNPFVAQLDPVTRSATGPFLNMTASGFGGVGACCSSKMWGACPPVNGITVMFDTSLVNKIRVARVKLTEPMALLSFSVISIQPGFKIVNCDATNERFFVATSAPVFAIYNATTGGIMFSRNMGSSGLGIFNIPFRPDLILLISPGSFVEFNLTYGFTDAFYKGRQITALSIGARFFGTTSTNGISSAAFDSTGRYLYLPFQTGAGSAPLPYSGILKFDVSNNYTIVARLNASLGVDLFWGVIDAYDTYGYWAAGALSGMTMLLKVDLQTLTIVSNTTSPYLNSSLTMQLDPIQSVLIPNFGGYVFDPSSLQTVGTIDALGMNMQTTAFFAYPGGPYGPCRYNGTCWGDTCSCAPGFSGTQCEFTPCNSITPSVCQNNGTCTPSPFVNETGYTCTCTTGWSGPQCETDVNECATNNGGCPAHRLCDNTAGSWSCSTMCDVGWVGTVNPSDTCTACAAGQYANTTGLAECFTCDEGFYQPDTGGSSCIPCASGHYANATGLVECAACDIGLYQTETEGTACFPCAEGQYANTTGLAECFTCDEGFYQPDTGGSSCVPCAAGRYANVTGMAECAACDTGNSQSGEGRTSCDLCGVHQVANETGSVLVHQLHGRNLPA
jgi:hypothetical protein